MFQTHTVMAGSLLFHPLLLTLLLVWGPGERVGVVEGGFLTTPACIAACLAGPCVGAAAACKCRHYFFNIIRIRGLWIWNDLFWIRLRIRIRRLRKVRLRLRIRILFRIRQCWSPPRESCARQTRTVLVKLQRYIKFFIKLTNLKSVVLKQVIYSLSMVSYRETYK
jgi:hypothetical protein